jgi:hypothetical protein
VKNIAPRAHLGWFSLANSLRFEYRSRHRGPTPPPVLSVISLPYLSSTAYPLIVSNRSDFKEVVTRARCNLETGEPLGDTGRTKLTAVQRDGGWTVRIVWPNGTNHHFGKFCSEIEAATWITDHLWMTATVITDRDLLRRGGRPQRFA